MNFGRLGICRASTLPPRRLAGAVVSLLLALVPAYARAQQSRPAILDNIGIDENLDAQLPLNLTFRDETGEDVKLGSLFHGRPVILAMVYYQCPRLCTLVLNDLTRTLNGMTMKVGEQFDILTVSFDPRETAELATAKKKQYLNIYRRPHAAEGWHFLTGEATSIQTLARVVGFRYAWDPKAQQFAHASGIMVLTPDGRVSRYFYGIEYPPTEIQAAIDDAAAKKIAAPGTTEKVLLYCFLYDPTTGRYSLIVSRALRVGGVLTLLAMGSFITLMLRRERVAAAHAPATPDGAGPDGRPGPPTGEGNG